MQAPEPTLPGMDKELRPPAFLSPSSISTWQQCPLKFKYSRIDKLSDPPTDATVLGNFVHDVLEALLRLPPADRTELAARNIMRDVWLNEYEAKAEDVLTAATPMSRMREALHEFRWKAWWCIENYFKMEDPKNEMFDGLEDYVEGAIGRVPMRGYIDRWHRTGDGIVIGDYKTGKTPKPQWQGDKFQQLAVYALLLGQIHDEPVARMELLYLKDGVRLTQPVEQPTLTAVAESIETVYDELLTACDTGEFATKKSVLCGWCAYKPFCPAWV
jgi:putative RecB family exonuclease